MPSYSLHYDPPDPYYPERRSISSMAYPDPEGTDFKSDRRAGDRERRKYLLHLDWCLSLGDMSDDEHEARSDAVRAAVTLPELQRLIRDLRPLRDDDYTEEGLRVQVWKDRLTESGSYWRRGAHLLVALLLAMFAIVPSILLQNYANHHHPAIMAVSVATAVLGGIGFIVNAASWFAYELD